MHKIRLEYIFSVWVFIIYVIYICKFIIFNPKFLLIFANLFNIVIISYLIAKKCPIEEIIKYIIITFFIKMLPLYTLLNTNIILNDIIISFIIFFIYIIYAITNNKNIVYEYFNLINVFLYGYNKEVVLFSI